jgi:hypothetical protein
MIINIDNKEILRDHTLKALIDSLAAAHGHDRCVRVTCEEGFCSFEILTIDQEASLES